MPLSPGRGLPAVRFCGNIGFRQLCCEKQAEYSLTQRHAQKDIVARGIVDEIKRRGGRFLRHYVPKRSKIAAPYDASSVPEWLEIEDDEATEKVKQTIRDNRRQPSDIYTARADNTSAEIPITCTAKRSSSLPSIPMAALPHKSPQPTAGLNLRSQEFGHVTSRHLQGCRPVVQKPTDWTTSTGKTGDLMSEKNRASLGARPRSQSLPLQHPVTDFLYNASILPPAKCSRGETFGQTWSLTDEMVRSTHDPNILGYTLPTQCLQQQQIVALPETYRETIQSLRPDQRDSFLLELPGAYQDLLPIMFSTAHLRGQPSPLTPRDVLLLHQARSLALQRGDPLRVSQVDTIFQTAEVFAGQERRNNLISLSTSMAGGGTYDLPPLVHHHHHQFHYTQQQFVSAASAGHMRLESAALPHFDDRKLPTQPTRPEQGDSSTSSSESDHLPLKKRARRD